MTIRRSAAACVLAIAGLCGGEAYARGFGGAVAAASIVSLGYDQTAAGSSLFGQGATTGGQAGQPYGHGMPTGPYSVGGSGGTGGSPVGGYTGFPGGLGSGGGGMRYFVNSPSSPSAASVESTYTIGPDGTMTQWGTKGSQVFQQGGGAARFPTDGGLGGSTDVAPGNGQHSTPAWSTNAMLTRGRAVRDSFDHYDAFTPAWFSGHPKAWAPANWATGLSPWDFATWPAVINWCNITGQPAFFDYGNTIVVANGRVFYNGTDIGTAEQYGQGAIDIAEQGLKATIGNDDAWMPLGIFAMVQGDSQSGNQAFELAINKNGVIRGNFFEPVVNTVAPVAGQVEVKSQRAAWCVGDSTQVVFETGIYNLTKPQTPLLVHMGTQKTQQWLLVRLMKPAGGK